MKYYLNLFFSVLKGNDGYEFGEINSKNPQNRRVFKFDEHQEAVFQEMLVGEGFEQSLLEEIFSDEIVKYWIDNKILIKVLIDNKNIYSRSMSYYWHNNMGNVQGILSQKSVLILGCGGIGSHVAWNLTSLGVGRIIILDFDVIEKSNLNRQILYDMDDIGRFKVEVLKEKLQKVNPIIKIEAINQKISSEEELEKLIKEYPVDCIVKALDTPLYFCDWLDKVCKENNTKYVAAIMIGSAQAVGPTYIPNVSAGFSELFHMDKTIDRVAGIAPSLGFVMYKMSGMVSEEVFKVLTGKGKLQYVDKIVLEEVAKSDTAIITTKNAKKILNIKDYQWNSLVNFVVILLIFYFGMCVVNNIAVARVVAVLFAIVGTVIIYPKKNEALIYGVTNFFYIAILNLISMSSEVYEAVFGNMSVLASITLILSFMSVLIILICMLQTLLFDLKNLILCRGSKI